MLSPLSVMVSKEDNICLLPENNLEEPKNNEKKKAVLDNKIEKIQGLRGIAIFGVLFYHIRNDWVPLGYLGVDVFFVISGFLMCRILSKYERLDFYNVLDFYFRRIKRILPIYLTVILLFNLTAILVWLYPLDYGRFVEESITPLFFIANRQQNNHNYFADSQGGYQFFLHLWSLSVELQFYLIVPSLIFLLSFCPILLKVIFVSLIATISFVHQVNSTQNREHMALYSRIWQFMFGFLAYYLSMWSYFNEDFMSKEVEFSKSSLYIKMHKLLDFLLNYCVTLFFIICLTFELTEYKPYDRLILLFCTIICIAYPSSSILLTNRPLVKLGDISYSVYLIHWFLYEIHHYKHFTVYLFKQKAPFLIAFLLIVSSIILGYIVEKTYNLLSKYLSDWKSLLAYIFVAYFLIANSIRYLKLNQERQSMFYESINSDLLNNGALIDNVMLDVFKNEDKIEWGRSHSMGYNNAFMKIGWELYTCQNRDNKAVPTDYDVLPMSLTNTCYMKGNGTKNMLVVGNSHATSHFYGVEKMFKGIYSNLTMIANHQCMFIELEKYWSVMSPWKYQKCQLFLNDLFKMLKMWHHKIDIIIVAHAYLPPTDPPILSTQNIAKDLLFQKIQTFYSKLSKFAKETLFVPVGHFETGIAPLKKILQRRIRYNQTLWMYSSPMSFNQNLWPNLKKRIRAIKCPNCIFLEWENFWCNKKSKTCNIIDFKRRLTLFSDKNHHSAYGSLIAGKHIYDKYVSWQRSQNSSLFDLEIN